jgi:hypothetical protein
MMINDSNDDGGGGGGDLLLCGVCTLLLITHTLCIYVCAHVFVYACLCMRVCCFSPCVRYIPACVRRALCAVCGAVLFTDTSSMYFAAL